MSRIPLRGAHATLAALTSAREVLEGGDDAGSATHLLLALLLLKIASDTTPREPTPDIAALAAVRSLPLLEAPHQAHFEYLFQQRYTPGNAPRFMAALRVLAQANPSQLCNVVPNLRLEEALPADAEQRDTALRRLFDRFCIPALDFRGRPLTYRPDVGDAVDRMLERAAGRRGSAASPHVPESLAWLMAALTDPGTDESVYDPPCDEGSLLLAAARWVSDAYGGHSRLGAHQWLLFGQDRDPGRCAVARLRLLLHGLSNLHVLAGDPLEEPLVDGGQLRRFRVCLACPPLTLRWSPARGYNDPHLRFMHAIAPRQWAHAALVQHMLATLDPQHGRMAVVVPHGVLFRDGAEACLRQAWLEANLVDTVIGLPDRLFAGTPVATALLVMRAARRDAAVLFVDGSVLCKPGTRKPRLDATAAEDIRRICAERASVPGIAHLVRTDEVAAGGGSLSVARYVQPAAASATAADLAAHRQHRIALTAQLDEVQQALNAELDALALELSTPE
jgi:type I restriction enzyme M protein